jgi:hypothetical protein
MLPGVPGGASCADSAHTAESKPGAVAQTDARRARLSLTGRCLFGVVQNGVFLYDADSEETRWQRPKWADRDRVATTPNAIETHARTTTV